MKKIILNGPLLSQSGYGKQARFALDALLSQPDKFDVYVATTNWGKTSWITTKDVYYNKIHKLLEKTQRYVSSSGASFDIHVQVGIPNEIKKLAPVNILYTAGTETNIVSHSWLNMINQIDRVITVSNHSTLGFTNSAYEIRENNKATGLIKAEVPVEHVSYPVPGFHFKNDAEFPNLELENFTFLAVSQWGPRKNLDATIAWFVEEFRNDDVTLLLKVSTMNHSVPDFYTTKKRMENIKKSFGEVKCKIKFVHGDCTDNEFDKLYQVKNVNCFINIAHGEGFGLPIFEAAYNGVPVVTHGWSGPSDFLYMGSEEKFARVPMYLNQIQPEAVWADILIKDSAWAFVNKEDYQKTIRKVYDNYEEYKTKAIELQDYLYKNFTEEKMYNKFCDLVSGETTVNEKDIEKWLEDMTEYE